MRIHFCALLILLFCVHTISAQICFDRPPFDGGTGKEDHDQAAYDASFNGCLMPDIDAYTIKGEHITSASLKGKIVVLYFWRMDADRLREVPYLNGIADSFPDKQVRFLGICEADSAKWDKRAEKYFHFDLISRSKSVLAKFKSSPVVILFDTHGQVLYAQSGFYTTDQPIRERSITIRRLIEENLPKK